MSDPPAPPPHPDEATCLRRELDLDVQRGRIPAADADRFARAGAPLRYALRARCRLAIERALPFVEVRMTAAPGGPAVPVDPAALLRGLRAWPPTHDHPPALLDVRLPPGPLAGLPEGHAAAPAHRVRRGRP